MKTKEITKLEQVLHQTITDYMKNHELYEPVDEVMIDEVIFMILTIADAKKEIRDNGVNLIKTASNGTTYTVTNPAVETYNKMIKNLSIVFTKLGIPPSVRKKIANIGDDEFDAALG